MRRRTFLAASPALLAGCLDASGPTPSPTTRTTTATTTTEASTTTSKTATATTTEQPYSLLPPEPTSIPAETIRERLDDHDCSEFTTLPTTCPGADDSLAVTVSPSVGELAVDTVEVTLENRTNDAFVWNAYHWRLQKWDGTAWRHLAPLSIPAPLDRIPPGESHTYRFTPVEDRPARSQHDYMTTSDVVLGGLGPGVYGFSTTGYFESEPDDELAVAAVFGFAGEAPVVRPTDDVTRVERRGSTLVVHADAPADRRAELVVSLGEREPSVRLLPEHVHQLAGLLNTLPYAATDGVESIRYVGHEGDVGMVESYLSALTQEAATRFGFRDLSFEVSAEGA